MFGSLMGDFEDDPFFGSHMRQMNNMMNSMFDPFGMMGQSMGMPALTHGPAHHPRGGMHQMMPFGFPQMPNMQQMFADLNQMTPGGNGHSFSSSSMITMTNAGDGRPQVYQESMSTRVGPGGIKETKKSVSDSRSGVKKLAIGHHIGDRAHILEREQNYYSGEQEENQEFINLEETEAESFNREWESKANRHLAAIAPAHRSHHGHRSHHHSHHNDQMLALPSTVPSSSSRYGERQIRDHHQRSQNPQQVKFAHSSKNVPTDYSRSQKNQSATNPSSSSSTNRSSSSPTLDVTTTSSPLDATISKGARKREHTPELETSKKRHYDEDEAIDLKVHRSDK